MELSFLEKYIYTLIGRARKYNVPFICAVISGILAHMFVMTNKLINADETSALFSKGATLTSGRWFLEFTKYIFPNYSMPWIYGVLSIIFISISACCILSIFKIKSRILSCILASSFTTFPSITAYMCYMFTSAPFCLAVLMSVLFVYFVKDLNFKKCIIGVLLQVLSLATYQAFISFSASLLIILLMQQLLLTDSVARTLFIRAVKYFLLLVLSLAVYYGITLIVNTVAGCELENSSYSFSDTSLIVRFITCYTSFAGIFIKGYFGFVRSLFSACIHILGLLTVAFIAFKKLKNEKSIYKKVLFVVLICLWPLAANCLYLVASPGVIQTLSVFPFVSIYVLFAVFSDSELLEKDIIMTALTLVVIMNVYAANTSYLKMYLDYENAYSYFTTLNSCIYSNSEYEHGMKVVIYGKAEHGIYHNDIDIGQMLGAHEYVTDFYTIDRFYKYYLGSDMNVEFIDDYSCYEDVFSDMDVYPGSGSIKVSDGTMFVKLSECS